MNKPKFKVGDRVRVAKEYYDEPYVIGKLGTIRRILGAGVCGIEFDENIGGHDLGGFCKNGAWLELFRKYA